MKIILNLIIEGGVATSLDHKQKDVVFNAEWALKYIGECVYTTKLPYGKILR